MTVVNIDNLTIINLGSCQVDAKVRIAACNCVIGVELIGYVIMAIKCDTLVMS